MAIVPRTMAPEKPDPGVFGNEFGRSYGVVAPHDRFTSIAVGQGLHAYMQGGWLAILPFMFLSGIFYRLAWGFVAEGRSAPVAALYAASAFQIATSVGTIWPLGFLGGVKALVLTMAVLLIASAAGYAFARPRKVHA
jgi:hypothetical protein